MSRPAGKLETTAKFDDIKLMFSLKTFRCRRKHIFMKTKLSTSLYYPKRKSVTSGGRQGRITRQGNISIPCLTDYKLL
jgi:hypothetical protein